MWTITQNQLCLTISTYTASIYLKRMVFNALPNSQYIYSLRSTLNNPMPRPQPHTALYSIHLSHCHGVYTHTQHPVQGSESHCLHFLTYGENLILLCFLLTFPSHIPTSFYYHIQKKWCEILYTEVELFILEFWSRLTQWRGTGKWQVQSSLHYIMVG